MADAKSLPTSSVSSGEADAMVFQIIDKTSFCKIIQVNYSISLWKSKEEKSFILQTLSTKTERANFKF
jgi:hypothetical protein